MYFISLLLVLLGIAEPHVENKTAVEKKADPVPRNVPASLNRNVMLQLVNKIRKSGYRCGDTYYYPAPPLTWNTQLEIAAYRHSADMYEQKFFSHIAPDGSRGGARITAAGYNWKAYGENIATGYKKEAEVVEGWKNSPGHCKNLMNPAYKEMGVARVGTYWTQEFARK